MASSDTWLINLVIVGLITVVFGYFLGLTIVGVVDRRMSDISINLPKINLPRQNIYVNLDGKDGGSPRQLQLHNQFSPNVGDLGPSYQLRSAHDPIKPLQTPMGGLQEGFASGGASGDDDSDLRISHAQMVKDFLPPQPPTVAPKADQIASNQLGRIEVDGLTATLDIDQRDDQRQDARQCQRNQCETRPAVGCRTDADCNVVYGNGHNKCLANNQCYCVEGSGLFCHYGSDLLQGSQRYDRSATV